MHSVGEGYCQSWASLTWSGDDWRWSTHGNLLHVATNHQQQATHRQYNFWSRLGCFQVRAMHKQHIYTRNSTHDLSVKLGPCICSHTDGSYPGCWHMWYLAMYLSRYLLMHDKSCFVQWQTQDFITSVRCIIVGRAWASSKLICLHRVTKPIHGH